MEGDIICVPRLVLVESLNSLKRELIKMMEDRSSKRISLQVTQKELDLVNGELREHDVLTESLREAARAEKRGEAGSRKMPREMTKSRELDVCVREWFYGFARAVYDRILEYAKLETSEPFFEWKSMAQS